MKTLAILFAFAIAPRAHADQLTKIFGCRNAEASMEVYGPRDPARSLSADFRTAGFYVLHLTEQSKGSPLEPVLLSLTADGSAIVVEQYQRGLPPTEIPLAGGIVSFDERFASRALCRPVK
jgi:hypothetical protein